MSLFSERYGYTKLSDFLIREAMPEEIENAVCSCYDRLEDYFSGNSPYNERYYSNLELYLWTHFLNKRRNHFFDDYGGHKVVATMVLQDRTVEWFKKLDMIELTVEWLNHEKQANQLMKQAAIKFISSLNREFERLHYAYRVVDKEIVDITSKNEIEAIEDAINNGDNNVKIHLQSALKLLSTKPIGDYRNSIKESISAVEAVSREWTGKSTLGDALNELERVGLDIPKVLKKGFEILYGYTNNKETGIRHALMDNDASYVPALAEAKFMLVSCSAFINYLYFKKTE